MTFSKTMILGNLTRDPELKQTPSGMVVANLGLAVNRKWKDKSGEMQEEATFIDCEAWGKTAELAGQYLTRGKPVFIEGRLKMDEWTDKTTGDKRTKLKVVIENLHFLPRQRSDDDGPDANPSKHKFSTTPPIDDSEEIPF